MFSIRLMTCLLVAGVSLMALTACGGSAGSHEKVSFNSSSSFSSSFNSSSSITPASSINTSSFSSTNSSSSISSSVSFAKILLHYGDNPMQVGELRLPVNTQGTPLPLVIIIHGGCWVSANADYHFMDHFSDAITQLGYATWNIEYRGIGTGGDWPTIFLDVASAVDYSRNFPKNYAVDINKVAIIGHSAGGHLALWAASRAGITPTSLVYFENPLALRGVLSLAGVADVTSLNACTNVASTIIGQPVNAATQVRLQETSPYQMLPISAKTVLISGSADGIVPGYIGTAYTNQANATGSQSVHYTLQGLDHFDLINPEKTNWPLYQQTLDTFFKN